MSFTRNAPRRLRDELVARTFYGWRWLEYTTSRPRPCRILVAPRFVTLREIPGGFEQIEGPITEQQCEIEPPLERVGYVYLPHYSTDLAEAFALVEALSLPERRPEGFATDLDRRLVHDACLELTTLQLTRKTAPQLASLIVEIVLDCFNLLPT